MKQNRVRKFSIALGAMLLFMLGIWIVFRSSGERLDNSPGAVARDGPSGSSLDRQFNVNAKPAKLSSSAKKIESSSDVPESGALVPDRDIGTAASGVMANNAAVRKTSTTPEPALSPSAASAERETQRVPLAWNINSPADPRHKLTSDTSEVWDGATSALMQAAQSSNPYLGSFMWQAVSAANFKGSRVRFSAYLKTDASTFGAFLVLRAEDRMGNVIAFDNMDGRWTGGNSGWQPYSVVEDVPSAADVLIYGVGLARAGTVRVDSAAIETVDTSVRVTAQTGPTGHINPPLDKSLILSVPTNMDFELSTGGSN